MRILAGRLKGRRLRTPPGRRTRPLLSRLRRALMDALAPELEGARVLDPFAGSGALVFEAISRGAACAVAIDLAPAAARTIEANARELGLGEQVRVIRGDALQVLPRLAAAGERFELVFVAPPYWQGLQPRALQALDELDLLVPGGLVVVQSASAERYPEPVLERLVPERERRYGNTAIAWYRRREG